MNVKIINIENKTMLFGSVNFGLVNFNRLNIEYDIVYLNLFNKNVSSNMFRRLIQHF